MILILLKFVLVNRERWASAGVTSVLSKTAARHSLKRSSRLRLFHAGTFRAFLQRTSRCFSLTRVLILWISVKKRNRHAINTRHKRRTERRFQHVWTHAFLRLRRLPTQLCTLKIEFSPELNWHLKDIFISILNWLNYKTHYHNTHPSCVQCRLCGIWTCDGY